MSTRTHELKTWPYYFAAVERGDKPFEIREADRIFEVGDFLFLREWDAHCGEYTGRSCLRKVTFVLGGGLLGIADGYVALGLAAVT